MDKVILAYSGGLDTSVILHWIREQYGAEIIAYTGDVGQGEDELDKARRAAEKTGVSEIVIEDLKEAFVCDYIFPALRANAVYETYYLMGTALARPVIGKGLIEAANRFGATTIAHGATGKGNDQVRFELAAYALRPDIRIIAPWREWDLKGRTDLIQYAQKYNIDLSAAPKPSYSMDANLMHISYEGGILEDPWESPPEDIFLLSVDPQQAPDTPTEMVIEFEAGIPVKVNDKAMGPVEILQELNRVAGANGVGRVDLVENRMVGMKSRGVYETPGMTVLHKTHRALESLTLDREVQHLKDELAPRIAELIYYGFWFAPEMKLLLQLVQNSQTRVTGKVRIQLYKGNCVIQGRSSPFNLYDPAYATFEADEVYSQADAQGFIQLQGLRLRVAALLEKGRQLEAVDKSS